MARDHGPYAVREACQKNHEDVHANEKNQGQRDEEMNRARGLLTAEALSEYGDHRCNRRRHGQTGEDDEREQHEDNREVSEPLHHVIRERFFFRGTLQTQIIPNEAPDAAPSEISLDWQQILAEMRRRSP